MKVTAVVFDWAGTIIDFGSLAPMGAFVKLFEQHGVAISIEQARVPMGLPKLDHIRALGATADIASAWRNAKGGVEFTDADAKALLQEFEPMSAKAAWEHRAFVPGFVETYQWLLDHGVRVATTTGYTRRIMTPIIEHTASLGFVPDLVICCDDVARSRPDPMGMFACCAAMNIQPGPHVVKVDDTAPGIAEGLNAGCTTFGVAASGNALGWSWQQWSDSEPAQRAQSLAAARARLVAAGSDYVIDSVLNLPDALARL